MYYAETRADNSGNANHRVTCLVVMGSPFDNEQVCRVSFHCLGQQNSMRVSNRPTDPKILPPTLTFVMPQKIIDRQNPEIRLRFRVCFRLHK